MNGGSAVCLRRFRTVDGVPFMRERVANLHHYGRMLMFHVELIVRSFSTSEHLRTPVKYSSPFWRYEKSRDDCISAIGEKSGPSSCTQDIGVIKFYEPYRDRFSRRFGRICCSSLHSPMRLNNMSRKLK